jgi:hypothetical protein
MLRKLLLFLLLPGFLFSAGPVTHLILGTRYLKTHREQNAAAFLRGTLFSDIRYMAAIPRSSTHDKGVTLSQINKAQGFEKGRLFHSYVDEKREKLVKEKKLSEYLVQKYSIPKDYVITFLKIVEDEYLDSRRDEALLQAALSTSSSYEESIPREIVTKYYVETALYIRQGPRKTLELALGENKPLYNIPIPVASFLVEIFEKVLKDKKILEHIDDLLKAFDEEEGDLMPETGLEPITSALRMRCSTN